MPPHETGGLSSAHEISSQPLLIVLGMSIAVIRILCEADPSLGTSIVNGLLAWATALGGVTAFCSGLPAALVALDDTPAHVRSDLINRGMGIGFRIGMLTGLLMFIVFIARIAS